VVAIYYLERDVLLVLEVTIDGRLSNADFVSDVVDGGLFEPVGLHQARRGFEDRASNVRAWGDAWHSNLYSEQIKVLIGICFYDTVLTIVSGWIWSRFVIETMFHAA